MDSNPSQYPILAYVISKLKPFGPAKAEDEILSGILQERPHLATPELLKLMKESIFDVLETRAVLETLGDRAAKEAVEKAKGRIGEIDSRLSKQLGEMVTAPRPEKVDRLRWRAMMSEKEGEIRRAAEEEKRGFRTVVQVDEMFDEYGKVVEAAEERLRRMYEAAVGGGDGEGEDEISEEVVGVLREASGKVLERVEICGRGLRSVPEAFGRIKGVVVMDFSNNQIQMIPDSIGGLELLEELKLSSNLLEALPDSIGLLQKLKILDASANKLTELPDSICRCKSLIELDVSFNNLKLLPTNIGDQLVHLIRLSVQLNKLCNLPPSICEMKSLRVLDTHFNQLHGLPHAIGQLTHLEILNLSSNFNDLTELPGSIGDLFNLKELDLSNNQFHTLPDTFGRLHSLTKLNLDQNPLAVPPQEIICQGMEAIKTFMAKRWLDILAEEERISMLEMQEQTQTGWLTRSTSWLNQVAAGVSESVSGYMSPRSTRDSYLDQQL